MPKSTASTKDKILARKEELKAKPKVEPARESDLLPALDEPAHKDLCVQPAPEESCDVATFQAAKLETPDIMASMVNLQAALADRTKERDEIKVKLDRTEFLLDVLKRSYGLAAASVVVETPNVPYGGTVIERFNAMPEGADKTKFYLEHKEELLKYANRGVPTPNEDIPETYYR